MADNPADKLAKGVARSVTPTGMFEKMGDRFDPLPVLQMLRQMLGGDQQKAPGLNEPLPRFGGLDERGQPVIIPPPGRSMLDNPGNMSQQERSMFGRMIQK